MCSSTPKVVTFEDVKNLSKDTLLIDVREVSELQATGVIPNSIHIPLGKLEDTFKNVPSDVFEKQFGIPKPDASQSMIFSCKAGIRSAKAVAIAQNLGFKNLGNYQGGWDDWEANSKAAK